MELGDEDARRPRRSVLGLLVIHKSKDRIILHLAAAFRFLGHFDGSGLDTISR